MTQSAVSQQIRSLETRFRVTLFERQARGLALTDEGRKLLPKVEMALEALGSATDRLDAATAKTDLRVSASVSVIEWVICPALPSFRSANPEISIRFQSTIWPDEFIGAQADVEIRFGSERQVGRHAQRLLPVELCALKSPQLAGDLADLPLIEAVGTSQGWSVWGEAAGITGLAPSVYADTYGLALELAATGNGVALASLALSRHALETGRLTLAHKTQIRGKEGYFLAFDQSLPAAVVFCDWLLNLTNRPWNG